MIESAAKEAGLDLNRPIPVDKLLAAMNAQRERGGRLRGFGGSSWGRPPNLLLLNIRQQQFVEFL